MNNIDKQRLHDFVEDMKLLAEQYGWELSYALGQIGYKQKTEDDLLLEVAKEKYKKGTVFYPLEKYYDCPIEMAQSHDLFVWCNKIMARTGIVNFCTIYDKETNTWAEIIN